MDRLSVGMHVEIMRSDGRVHGALVTQLKNETKSVSVEWFEKGETKGKEVDLTMLIKNNPMLFQQPTVIKNAATAPTVNDVPKPAATNMRRTLMPRIPQSRPTVAVTKAQVEASKAKISETKGRAVEAKEKDLSPTEEQSNMIPKSQVVSKIEEMERVREYRRTQHVEAKKQRDLQKNIDPGNPNWQFLSMIRDYQCQVDYKPLKMSDSVADNRICVCVRKRPINKKELAKKEIEIITIPNKDHIIVHQPQVKVDLTKYLDNQVFRFDYTFDENTQNDMVYKFTAQPLVQTIFQGGFATCFAYGQTGSGKTHTMGGNFDGKTQNCSNGIYALTAIDVFKMLKSNDYKNANLSVSCSFFEIYGAKVFDLLGKKAKLRVLEDGNKLVQVVGLKEFKVHNCDDVLKLIHQGSEQRTAGQTSANSNSSRSHAVFQIILRKKDGNKENLYGKFSLIDLAGNERGADTISSDRQTRLEGAEINKSLLALKECIRAMGRDVNHIPFRGSKLTLILRDSFVGKNAKTCMIAMISPGMSSVENTLNTLRYADRVKELGNENGGTSSAPLSDSFFLNTDAGYTDENDTKLLDDHMLIHQRSDFLSSDELNDALQLSDTMTEKVYKHQLAIENMNRAEENAIDEHQLLYEKLQSSLLTMSGRLEETNLVDYDVESYARNSVKDLCEIINAISKCKGNFEHLLSCIAAEQELSGEK